MGTINVRKNVITDSTTEAMTSLSKKRVTILTNRKQTALDTDSVNAKLKSTIINYVKETNNGNNFNCIIDIEDNKTIFKLTLDANLHLTKSMESNLFALKPDVMISHIDSNINYLKQLRSTIELPENKAFPFQLDTDDETTFPLVILNIKTRTKYF